MGCAFSASSGNVQRADWSQVAWPWQCLTALFASWAILKKLQNAVYHKAVTQLRSGNVSCTP